MIAETHRYESHSCHMMNAEICRLLEDVFVASIYQLLSLFVNSTKYIFTILLSIISYRPI